MSKGNAEILSCIESPLNINKAQKFRSVHIALSGSRFCYAQKGSTQFNLVSGLNWDLQTQKRVVLKIPLRTDTLLLEKTSTMHLAFKILTVCYFLTNLDRKNKSYNKICKPKHTQISQGGHVN